MGNVDMDVRGGWRWQQVGVRRALQLCHGVRQRRE